MGIYFQGIKLTAMKKGKEGHSSLNLTTSWVWIVLRRDPDLNPQGFHDWHMQGVGADEEIAKEMCLDENYMIGPLPLNIALPHDYMEWVGAYCPLKV